jgi:hypothetical protein
VGALLVRVLAGGYLTQPCVHMPSEDTFYVIQPIPNLPKESRERLFYAVRIFLGRKLIVACHDSTPLVFTYFTVW